MQKPEERKSNRVIRVLIYLIPIFAILGAYGAIIAVTQETYPFTIVTGTSMQPTILPGTIAVIDKVPFNQLKNGDVIVFRPQISLEYSCDSSPSNSLTQETAVPCYVIHRIVDITTNAQGERIITTKGDNNPDSISDPPIDVDINSSMYIGQVVLLFPLLGYATIQPYNEYLALLILVLLAVQLLFDRNTSKKEKAGTTAVPQASGLQPS